MEPVTTIVTTGNVHDSIQCLQLMKDAREYKTMIIHDWRHFQCIGTSINSDRFLKGCEGLQEQLSGGEIREVSFKSW